MKKICLKFGSFDQRFLRNGTSFAPEVVGTSRQI